MTTIEQAICRQPGVDPDDWFRGSDTPRGRQAALACLSCPLKADCAAYALRKGMPYGIWGGMTPEDRQRYWAKHGGQPRDFMTEIDQAINPLIRERKIAEGLVAV